MVRLETAVAWLRGRYGTLCGAPELREHLSGKVSQVLRPEGTHGRVLGVSAHLGVHRQRWLGEQARSEGVVDQGSADRSINLAADPTLFWPARPERANTA